MILLSPVVGTAAAAGAALVALAALVFFVTPPAGAAVAAAALTAAARRRGRPARAGLVSFMISSRDWLSFPCPDMVFVVKMFGG